MPRPNGEGTIRRLRVVLRSCYGDRFTAGVDPESRESSVVSLAGSPGGTHFSSSHLLRGGSQRLLRGRLSFVYCLSDCPGWTLSPGSSARAAGPPLLHLPPSKEIDGSNIRRVEPGLKGGRSNQAAHQRQGFFPVTFNTLSGRVIRRVSPAEAGPLRCPSR
ncbi:hypothetical protein SKAU_G00056630 [Synaphobranchus kaupii]|uniref:Uncharacterized protein n=1 Tax=Synaphobranchus kaupii TaxID=118154 RepID=A0A9Q1G3Z9_SYNKA|nr:hypothetical protein SKAU_G00056630 [Synaphobranchus kaupii]